MIIYISSVHERRLALADSRVFPRTLWPFKLVWLLDLARNSLAPVCERSGFTSSDGGAVICFFYSILFPQIKKKFVP